MLFLVTIALCGAISFGESATQAKEFKLPEGVKICYEDDPNLNECVKEMIQDLMPKLHKGNKQLGVPPLDPYTIQKTQISYSNGDIQGTFALKGVKIYGGTQLEVKRVDMKIFDGGLTFENEVFVPRVYIEGSYKADVTINDFKMNPKGYFNVTMSNMNFVNKVTGTFETIDGVKYLRLKSYDVVPEIGDMKMFATGIFPDPQLNDLILNFANQHWKDTYKVVLAETKTHWEPILINMINRFFRLLPFEALIKKRTE